MKKLLASLMLTLSLTFGMSANLLAQDTTGAATADTAAAPAAAATEDIAPVTTTDDAAPAEEQSFHQVVKENFISGGVEYMVPILLCLILGLAIAIERIITLNLASTNTTKLLNRIED